MSRENEQFIGVSGQVPEGPMGDFGVVAERGYGRENPNRRVEFGQPLTSSMRAERTRQIREIVEDVGGAVRIGKVNRFR